MLGPSICTLIDQTVLYQIVLRRLWTCVYNLRISHSYDGVIIYKDDLVSAFKALRYQPDVVPAYLFVLNSFLIILVLYVVLLRSAELDFHLALPILA